MKKSIFNHTSESSEKYDCIVTFFHDIEQDFDSNSDVDKCREALKESLRIEKKNNVKATYNIVGRLFVEQPDIIDKVKSQGNEVAFHSFNHQSDWNPLLYRNEIKLCRSISSLPVGFRSPRSQWNITTLRTLKEFGFLWDAEDDKHNEPYLIWDGLVRVPVSQNDWHLFKGKISHKEWRREFELGIEKKNYYAIGTHDYILSKGEEYLGSYESIVERSHELNLLIVPFNQAAELYLGYLAKMRGWKKKSHQRREWSDLLDKIRFDMEKPRFPIIRNSIIQNYYKLKRNLSI